MLDEEFSQVVQDRSNQLTAVRNKLNWFGDVLKLWNRGKFFNIEWIIKSKIAQLKALRREEGPGEVARIKILQHEIDLLLEQKDLKWKQMAKIN